MATPNEEYNLNKIDLDEWDWLFLASGSWKHIALATIYVMAAAHPSKRLESAFSELIQLRKRNPKPFKTFFILVDLTQIFLCSRIILQIMFSGSRNGIIFYCHRGGPTDGGTTSPIGNACWLYHISNCVALLDSVHLKLNGKKVSFLHAYHHSSALLWSWIVAKFVPGTHSVFSVLGISTCHTAIYTYYLAALIGVNFNRYACWLSITIMQMVLIAVGIVHMALVLLNQCQYPGLFATLYILFSSFLLYLFFDHFYSNRTKKSLLKPYGKGPKNYLK